VNLSPSLYPKNCSGDTNSFERINSKENRKYKNINCFLINTPLLHFEYACDFQLGQKQ